MGARARLGSYRGTSLIRKRTPPQGRHMSLGIVLVKGPRGWRFLMSEVPLYYDRPDSVIVSRNACRDYNPPQLSSVMYSKRHMPDIEQWSQSSGSNVIPRRARPGLAGLRPHTQCHLIPLRWS